MLARYAHFLALGATISIAPCLEGQWVPDLARGDKRSHVAMGVVAAALTDGTLGLGILPAWTERPWVRRLAPVAGALVVGIAKEVLDARDPDNHTSERGDITATALGGACYSLTLCWRF